MTKTLIIGQAPSKETVGKLPFSGKSGPRFASLLGVPHERLWEAFEVMNLIDYYPGPPKDGTKRGDAFPRIEARERAAQMKPTLAGRTVVLVGMNVARAFGWGDLPFFTWQEVELPRIPKDNGGFIASQTRVCVVPHPSGINHFWNNPENVDNARSFMTQIPR